MWKFSAGDLARWHPEVPSNLINCVILISILNDKSFSCCQHMRLQHSLTTLTLNNFFPYTSHNSPHCSCDCCLSCFHCVPLRRAWPCLLCKFPLEPWSQQLDLFSLLFSRLNILSSLHVSHNYSPWTLTPFHCSLSCTTRPRAVKFHTHLLFSQNGLFAEPPLLVGLMENSPTPFWPFLLLDTAHLFGLLLCDRLLTVLITLAKFPSSWLFQFFTLNKDKQVLTGGCL